MDYEANPGGGIREAGQADVVASADPVTPSETSATETEAVTETVAAPEVTEVSASADPVTSVQNPAPETPASEGSEESSDTENSEGTTTAQAESVEASA